jgi:hypothetical protein
MGAIGRLFFADDSVSNIVKTDASQELLSTAYRGLRKRSLPLEPALTPITINNYLRAAGAP